jgi:hypothetical protein
MAGACNVMVTWVKMWKEQPPGKWFNELDKLTLIMKHSTLFSNLIVDNLVRRPR